jgi:hypothetical protein
LIAAFKADQNERLRGINMSVCLVTLPHRAG